jgi:hypothetical protein
MYIFLSYSFSHAYIKAFIIKKSAHIRFILNESIKIKDFILLVDYLQKTKMPAYELFLIAKNLPRVHQLTIIQIIFQIKNITAFIYNKKA